MKTIIDKILIRKNDLKAIPLPSLVNLPSKEELEQSRLDYKLNEDQKLKSDCEYMMDLLNKTLQDSLNKKDRKWIVNYIDLNKIHDYENITLKKCIQYEKYIEELKERDVKFKVVKTSNEKPDVSFNRETKELMVFTRWCI
jgi:hypothetical protein